MAPTSTSPVVPPIRAWDGEHGTPDTFDPQRIALVREHRWDLQTAALLQRDRTIEENVRMLAGRQWDVWSDTMGQFVDPSQYLTDSEKRWRQRPVVNLLQYWFMLTHARITESAPLPIFQPATADWLDVQLAEVLEPIIKTLWPETGMDEAFVGAAAWLIASGECYVESQVDWTRGPMRQALAPALLQGADGQAMPTQGPVPYDSNGNALASLTDDGQGYQVPDDAEPYTDHEGCISPRVRSPLEVRAEWGADVPWERRRWIITRSYLTPEEVKAQFGVDVQGDMVGDGASAFLQRLLFSSGHFGAVSNRWGGNGLVREASAYVAVDTCWEQPSAMSPETDDSPGGRLLVVTKDVVLHDSVRPYHTKAAGPIRRAQFIQQPGRGGFGSTPLEQLVPIQKTWNRGWAQILEHRNLCTNPILLVDQASGLDQVLTNVPGQTVTTDFTATGGQPPAAYLIPPPISADVWRTQSQLLDTIRMLGSIAGAEGTPQTDDPSGQLVSELRFNSDRPVAIAARSLAHLCSGVIEDWIAILPNLWTEEKTIQYAGEDQMYRTVAVGPELWSGDVNVRPDLVNARVESPQAKEARAMGMYQAGIMGAPGTDEARQQFLDYSQIPGSAGLSQNNSPDAATCRQIMGRLAEGQMHPQDVQALLKPWYNYALWLKVLRDHVASPAYLRYPPDVQQAFDQFYAMVQQAQVAAAQALAPVAANTMAPMVAAHGMLARLAQSTGPQPMLPPPGDNAPPMNPSESAGAPPGAAPMPPDSGAMPARAA